MNTFVFVGLVMLAEAWIVWMAYTVGHHSGWLDGWEERRK